MTTVTKTQAIVEQSTLRKQRAPELAKQAKQRRAGRADGGVRAVEHTVHASRTQQVAEDKEVVRAPKRRWQRAAALPAMPELPGFNVEWVRRDNQHRGDHANMIAHISEGWELCRKSDFPKHALPTQRLSDQGEVIGNDSSILMKIEDDLFAQRNAFYNTRRNKATDAVNRPDQGLTEAMHPAMPLVEDVNRSERRLHKLRRKRRGDGEDVVAGEGFPD